MEHNEKTITIRVPADVLEQLDAERKRLKESDPAVSYSRADAIRRVLLRGLQAGK